MSNQVRCHCQSCAIRSLTGPAILITLGVLFLLHQLHGGYFDFGNTWPMILVVIGLLHLAAALAPRDGHIEAQTSTAVPGVPPPPPAGAPPPVSPSERQ
ncbi:MAG TPA: DUF5668 domain-containing protein [Candidatus Acidoferrum sp.]|nr:DUF5668 domain-containing protein [Candidatus Acidoferrum sp.]